MKSPDLAATHDLLRYIDASPSPFHAVDESARRLEAAGFGLRDERSSWQGQTGAGYIRRGGSLVAWRLADDSADTSFRIIGAHTDSPNLRIKPRPDSGNAGYRQLGVEVYGGVLLNSWLDRDLGISGRVLVRQGAGSETRLFKVDRPLLRVAQLAIHLDREVVEDGLKLDRQQHLAPIWGLGTSEEGDFVAFLAKELGVEAGAVASYDIMAHDLTPSALLGRDDELYAAPRIDNLASCHAAVSALMATEVTNGVIVLFDHEEIGSQSAAGAGSPILRDTLERLVLARGGDREAYHRSVAGSWCVSADGAHAVHPNYLDRYEPEHHVELNGGPAIKANANVRYASDAESSAMFVAACEAAEVPHQVYVNRTNLACGSTIGPITAASLGLRTVDVGCGQLSMHSARELGGAHDAAYMQAALGQFLSG